MVLPLGRLVLLPRPALLFGRADGGIAEDVGMAAFHLVADGFNDIVEIEMATLLGHARMEHDLEQQVAKLIAQLVHGIALDSIGNFVSFLDRVGGDG